MLANSAPAPVAVAEFWTLEELLFMAGELRSLAPVDADSVLTSFNFKIAQPRGHIIDQLMIFIRARFVLVVSDLKPVLREGHRAQGWLQR